MCPGPGSTRRSRSCCVITACGRRLRNFPQSPKRRRANHGIYEGRYRIEDGVVYPAVDASWGGKGRKGKGKAQDVGGGREEVGSCEA